MRDALHLTFGRCDDITVVGTASDGEQAVTAARELSPDVVVMDVRMPGMTGAEATRLITRETPDIRVLVLTTFDFDEYVHAALRAGAVLAPSVTHRLITTFAALPPALVAPPDLSGCTPRERAVVVLVALCSGSAVLNPRRERVAARSS